MVQKPIYSLATYIYANISVCFAIFPLASPVPALSILPLMSVHIHMYMCVCIKSHNTVLEPFEDKLHILWPLTPKYFSVYFCLLSLSRTSSMM